MKGVRTLGAALVPLLARARASVWALPIAKVILAVGGLTLFAVLGRSAMAGATPELGTQTAAAPAVSAAATVALAVPPSSPPEAPVAPGAREPPPITAQAQTQAQAQARATEASPVVLNTATEEELRRLPGIGPKKATAILALRQKLGRFRQVDELLRVKGVGRTTLKRLRPLLRVDPAPVADAGAPSS